MLTIEVDSMEIVCEIALITKIDTFFWGPSGIGKTTIIRKASEKFAEYNELELRYVDIRLADCQPDTWGIPYFENSDIPGNPKVNRRSKPDWLPDEDYKGLFVLVFDEYILGAKQERAAAMQMLSERKLHTYALPENTVIFAAGNFDIARFGGTPLKEQEKNRFSHIYVSSEKESFINNMKDEIDDSFLSLVNSNLFKIAEEDKMSSAERIKVESYNGLCPRSLMNFSRLFNYARELDDDELDLQYEHISALSEGLIGKVNTAVFLSSFYCKKITLKEIIDDPTLYKEFLTEDNINICEEITAGTPLLYLLQEPKRINTFLNYLIFLKRSCNELLLSSIDSLSRTEIGRKVLESLSGSNEFKNLLGSK